MLIVNVNITFNKKACHNIEQTDRFICLRQILLEKLKTARLSNALHFTTFIVM